MDSNTTFGKMVQLQKITSFSNPIINCQMLKARCSNPEDELWMGEVEKRIPYQNHFYLIYSENKKRPCVDRTFQIWTANKLKHVQTGISVALNTKFPQRSSHVCKAISYVQHMYDEHQHGTASIFH